MEFHFQIKNIFPFVSKTLHPYFLGIFHVALIIETHIKWCLMGIYVILRCGGNFHFRLVPTNSKGCSHHALTRFNLWEKRERERKGERQLSNNSVWKVLDISVPHTSNPFRLKQHLDSSIFFHGRICPSTQIIVQYIYNDQRN